MWLSQWLYLKRKKNSKSLRTRKLNKGNDLDSSRRKFGEENLDGHFQFSYLHLLRPPRLSLVLNIHILIVQLLSLPLQFSAAPERPFLRTPNATTTSSTLSIQWNPPAVRSRNGLISVYHLSYLWMSSLQSKPPPEQLLHHATPITRTSLQQDDLVSVTLVGLEELAIYDVQISACTQSSMCVAESFSVSTKGKACVSFSLAINFLSSWASSPSSYASTAELKHSGILQHQM